MATDAAMASIGMAPRSTGGSLVEQTVPGTDDQIRVTGHRDELHGTVEALVDGQWVDTGLTAEWDFEQEGYDVDLDALLDAGILTADEGQPERTVNPPKAESPVWQDAPRYQGRLKSNGKTGRDMEVWDWDHTHNDIEVYDRKGRHLGSRDPVTGEMYKGPKDGRKLD